MVTGWGFGFCNWGLGFLKSNLCISYIWAKICQNNNVNSCTGGGQSEKFAKKPRTRNQEPRTKRTMHAHNMFIFSWDSHGYGCALLKILPPLDLLLRLGRSAHVFPRPTSPVVCWQLLMTAKLSGGWQLL